MNALILFSYGSMKSMDDIKAFYHHLSHGKVSDERLERGYRLFRSMGTCDPLTSTTKRIGHALVKRLQRETGEKWKYYIGNKHTYPFIEDAVEQCMEDGAQKIFTLPLTPLYSKTGTQVYERTVVKAVNKLCEKPIPLTHIPAYYQDKAFIHLLSDRMLDAMHWLPEDVQKDSAIIFTSHSMPGTNETQRDFIHQYNDLAEKVMEKVPLRPYHLAYRSAGPGSQQWLGPDVLDVIRDLAKEGRKAIIVSELLSIIANAEVIQEVGRDAKELAHSLGMEFVQTEYLNDSADFVDVLSDWCLSLPEIPRILSKVLG